jgi:8-oxo-dGTP pyrophosphatase MutT (NUDIX family)
MKEKMEHIELIQLLENYNPIFPEEIVFKKDMLAFVSEHHNCFERSLSIGHITASAWLLNKDRTKALLTHHAKLGKWFQLGGHCDGNPHVVAVAIKEAQEESGIKNIVPVSQEIFDIDIHLIPENKKEKAHYHYDVRFLLCVTSDEEIKQNKESKELRWIGQNKTDLPTDNLSVVRMFNKWISLNFLK